jgi:Transposase domain (DUF772)
VDRFDGRNPANSGGVADVSVVQESRLELGRLLFPDFDKSVSWIAAQPFLLEAMVGGCGPGAAPTVASTSKVGYHQNASSDEAVKVLLDLVAEWDQVALVIDQKSPAAVLRSHLAEQGVEVEMTNASQLALACRGFLDAVLDKRLSHTDQRVLADTVASAMIVAVVMVLQRFEGLSDREAVERFAFDARWKYAAGGLDFDYPGFVHTVLVDMRAGWPARSDRTGFSRPPWGWPSRRGWWAGGGCWIRPRCMTRWPRWTR